MTHKFLFYGNATYANRGCEAIVRGTTEILRRAFGADTTFVNAYSPQGNHPKETDSAIESYALRYDLSCFPPINRANRVLGKVFYRVGMVPIVRGLDLQKMHLQRLGSAFFPDAAMHTAGCTAALALGGDNYTLDYGFPAWFLALDAVIKKSRQRIVYWGASIGPFANSSEGFVMHHLRTHGHAFFVREERTLQYLNQHGIRHNAHLAPDPAFVMKPIPLSATELGFSLPRDAIGINLSPLMARFVCGGDMDRWTGICQETLVRMLSELDQPIVLIPHVTTTGPNDHGFMHSLMARLPKNDRVFLVGPSFSAAQTKWLISQCCCLAAARTHATVAAFSSGVPTISLAYSRKAYGINEQLFGHARYVIPPEDTTPARILSTLKHVLANAREISEHLMARQAATERAAFAAGEQLRDILCR